MRPAYGEPGAREGRPSLALGRFLIDANVYCVKLKQVCGKCELVFFEGSAQLERDFIRKLSPESRWMRMRFPGQIGDPSDSLVRRLTDLDYWHDMAFVALARESVSAATALHPTANHASAIHEQR